MPKFREESTRWALMSEAQQREELEEDLKYLRGLSARLNGDNLYGFRRVGSLIRYVEWQLSGRRVAAEAEPVGCGREIRMPYKDD